MSKRSITVWLPKYALAQQFLSIMNGTSHSQYLAMWKDITSQSGTKQYTVNWTDPAVWIPDRLTGDSLNLAIRLWRESGKLINPRWSYEIWRFVYSYNLALTENGCVVHSPIGKRFISGDEAIVHEIDDKEGVLFLLNEIADKGPGARRDFIDTYSRYCNLVTTWTDSSIANSFSARLKNLADRNLIAIEGRTYQITDLGLTYLQRVSGGGTGLEPTVELLVNKKNSMARKQLAEFLQSMDPYQFEHLIKRLLEEMGYSDVEVTAASNDKGVDVVAEIELGISHVREVIQVKRQKSNIGRPILDQLRGSLHYFQAVRGSIISTSGFAKNAQKSAFAPGVAPITLIDGDRLVNLLIEHNIGIRRREVRILEFDAESLRQFDSEEEPILPSSRQLESE